MGLHADVNLLYDAQEIVHYVLLFLSELWRVFRRCLRLIMEFNHFLANVLSEDSNGLIDGVICSFASLAQALLLLEL